MDNGDNNESWREVQKGDPMRYWRQVIAERDLKAQSGISPQPGEKVAFYAVSVGIILACIAVVAVIFLLSGCSSFWLPEPSRPAPIVLLAPDGDVVARLDAAPYRADDGSLPVVIHHKGRTFTRCWMNEGTHSKDEMFWCEEVKR